MYVSCVAVCANGRDVVFPRRIVNCQWEEMFGNLSDRLMAVSRSTVVKTTSQISL